MIVLNVGCMDNDRHHVSPGVGCDMTFATVDPFGGIVAAYITRFGCFHTLAVDDCGTRLRLATLWLAALSEQGTVHPLPKSIAAQLAKMIVNTVEIGEVMRQVSPGSARAQYIEYRIHHLPLLQFHRPSRPFPFTTQEGPDDFPCLLRRAHPKLLSVKRGQAILQAEVTTGLSSLYKNLGCTRCVRSLAYPRISCDNTLSCLA